MSQIGIIGAGIAGLSHAWLAAEHGHSVTLFERSPRAEGASIRNFGMVWPVGQPAGENLRVALRSRERWLKLCQCAGIWNNPCGSLHLAHRTDEWDLLREFYDLSRSLGYDCQLLSPDETISRARAANPEGLHGSLFSSTEVCVHAREAIRAIPDWLAHQWKVQFEFRTTITQVNGTDLLTGDGRRWSFDRVIVCGGVDSESLFPELMSKSGLKRCKLQMLRTKSQPSQWQIGPMLASGLTLRHYKCFEICSRLAALKKRIADETPELDHFGIHVMASQAPDGAVILGDSHEYDAQIDPFDKQEIDALILRELRKIIRLQDWTIAEHWHGVYAKHPELSCFSAEPLPEVFVRTGLGGAGMTMALGLAERDWEQWS